MSYCIVAIPSEDNPVWEYSSEKVPHMTLLFLGDQLDNEAEVAEFIQYVAEQQLSRFSLSVTRRGILGPDKADVLFFPKRLSRDVMDFRFNLLQHKDIAKAYNSTEQFPQWTPHLTMGYPDKPAKRDGDCPASVSWVDFDRVALWVADSDGPTFDLPRWQDEEMSLVMSEATEDKDSLEHEEEEMASTDFDDPVNEFLAHYGVKGMKWGVRRTDAQLGNSDGGSNGVKSKSGVDVVKSKLAGGGRLSRKERKIALEEARRNKAEKKKAKEDGLEIDDPSDIRLSADAERFVRTRLKPGHAMSDAEIKAAINRKKQVDEYEKLFAVSDNKDILTKLERLETQKRISQIEAEMNPSKAKKLISSVSNSYAAFNTFNSKLGSPIYDPLAEFSSAAREATKKLGDKGKKKDGGDSKKGRNDDRRDRDDSDGKGGKNDDADSGSGNSSVPSRTVPPSGPNANSVRAPQDLSTQAAPGRDNSRPTPAIPAAQAAPPRPTYPPPAARTQVPGTLKVPTGKSGTVVRPPIVGPNHTRKRPKIGPTDTVVRHEDEVEDFLAHYGVKGMKWGVRRSAEELSPRVEKLRAKQGKIAEKRSSAKAQLARASKKEASFAKKDRAKGYTLSSVQSRKLSKLQDTLAKKRAAFEKLDDRHSALSKRVDKLDRKIMARGRRELKLLMKDAESALQEHDGTDSSYENLSDINRSIKTQRNLVDRSTVLSS